MRTSAPAIIAGASLLILASTTAAATWYWAGWSGDAPWDTEGQWTDIGIPAFDDTGAGPHGEDLIFPADSTAATINLRNVNARDAVLSMRFEVGGPAHTFQRPAYPAQPVHLWGDMVNLSPVTQTFATGIIIEGANQISGTQGDSATGYAFNFGPRLTLAGTPTYTGPFAAHITGTSANALEGSATFTINDGSVVVEGGWDGVLTKRGTGSLILNGPSVTAGKLTITAGVVRVGHNSALGMSGASRNTILAGGSTGTGTLQFYRDITVNEYLSLAGREQAAGATVALETESGSNLFSGTISLQGGGNHYNFGALTGKLKVTGNLVFPASLTGGRYLTFRGAGDGEFTGSLGANHVGADPTAPGHLTIIHYGSGTLTLAGANNWRLGHLLAIGGGTLRLAAGFGNLEADQTNFPLFAATDDLPTQHTTRCVLANGSTLDCSALTTTGGSNVGLPGGGLLLNRTLAGTGTILGNVQAAAGGTASLEPGDGVAWDPADPSGAGLDPQDAFPAAAGALTFANELDLSTGPANYIWHLAALVDQTNGVAGTDWDLLRVNGQTKLSPADALTLSFAITPDGGPSAGNPFWNAAHTWKLLDTETNGTGDANFGTILLADTLIDNGAFSVSLGAGADAGDVFLNWTPSAVQHLPDIDVDGDVDADDYAALLVCFRGPALAMMPGCSNRDFDLDGDVDQTDFGIWQTCFSGANAQAVQPACTQVTVPPPTP